MPYAKQDKSIQRATTVKIFRDALLGWQAWLRDSDENWRRMNIGQHLLREDISNLRIINYSGPPGSLFDHKEHERIFILYDALLDIFALFWNSRKIDRRKQRLMAELFLLHEFYHIAHGVSSSKYDRDGQSATNFFAPIDYHADADAITLCYERYQGKQEPFDKTVLTRLMECQYLAGHIFGVLEEGESGQKRSIGGSRLRRQIVWALQYCRVKGFPPEAEFKSLVFDQEIKVQLFPCTRDGLGQDLCDYDRVGLANFAPPLALFVLLNGKQRVEHFLVTKKATSALAALMLDASLDNAMEAFRALFVERPDIVGRRGSFTQGGALPHDDLELNTYSWQLSRAPIAALLRADFEVVPFHMRRKELAEFISWSKRSDSLLIRVLAGDGGVGKTRFARQFAQTLKEDQKWQAGFLSWHPSMERRPTFLDENRKPLLVIIDYADSHANYLSSIVNLLLSRKGKTRILLLARTAGEWLEKVKRQGDPVAQFLQSSSTDIYRMHGVGETAFERERTLKAAYQAFARKLGESVPDRIPLETAPDASNTLHLHAWILSALFGMQLDSSDSVLVWLTDRERRFWDDQSRIRGLPSSIDPLLCEVAALSCTTDGATTEEEALKLVRCSPLASDQPATTVTAIAHLFHDLYPGPRWLNPVQPDLVKETIIARFLSDAARRNLTKLMETG